jgi:DNA adenine methylase
VDSPIKWVGGKRNLRKLIVGIMPSHFQYVEVFGGAGWVLLYKSPSKLEILNDLNGDLINFYKVI